MIPQEQLEEMVDAAFEAEYSITKVNYSLGNKGIAGSKGGEETASTPYEAPDNLRSIATAKILLALGEGEFKGLLTGQQIFLDGTPILDQSGNENFTNVKWEFRSGSQDQTYIQGIPDVENEIAISTELTLVSPNWIRSITDASLSAVNIRLYWPALMKQEDNGDLGGYSISYAIDISSNGGAYTTVINTAVTGKTTSGYERTHRIDLPQGNSNWSVRVRRITPKQTSGSIQDSMFVQAYTEVIDRKFRYPNTALLYVEFDAAQFKNVPQISCLPYGRQIRVPSNYDPILRTYSGTWDGTFKIDWTDNPAWIVYDIILNERFGLGKRINQAMVDRYNFYQIAQYCDQLVPDGKGGTEPRYICNIYIQGQEEAWQVLRDLASIYRGMVYWAQDQMYSFADMPRDVDFVYSRSNVIDGKFSYSSSSEKVRYTRAIISYDNPDNHYNSDITVVTDQKLQTRYGDTPVELAAIGCTRESEAQRRGKWAIYTNAADRGVSFDVGLDGNIPKPGYIIGVADQMLSGRVNAGRLTSVTSNVRVTLDRDVPLNVGDRLLLNLPSGKNEARTVQTVNGRIITVTTAYSELPEKELVYAVEYSDLAIQQFRVTNVARTDDVTFTITAVQHDPSKYNNIDTGARLTDRPISVIPTGAQEPPNDVKITSTVNVEQTMAVTTMTIIWNPAKNAVAYDVEWRKDNSEWIKLPRTGLLSADVKGVYTGNYLARVRAVSAFDVQSQPKSSTLTAIVGKTGDVPALSFLSTTSKVFGIQLDWGFPQYSEDTQRTEIQYNTIAEEIGANLLGEYSYPTSTHTMTGLAAGQIFWFRGRIVDRTGNIGPWNSWVSGQASTSASAVLSYLTSQITETQLGTDLLTRLDETDVDINDINTQIDVLQTQINEITGAGDWDNTTTYDVGDLVVFDGGLYRAVQVVPMNNPPPNPVYWDYIGAYASISEAVAALAASVDSLSAQVTVLDGEVEAQATQVAGVVAAITPKFAGGTDWDAGTTLVKAGAWTLYSAYASNDLALSKRIDSTIATIGDVQAGVVVETTARAEADSALATQITTLQATVNTNNLAVSAAVQNEALARANADTAIAGTVTTVNSRVDDANTRITAAEASVVSEANTRASQDGVLANNITTVQANLNNTNAIVQTNSQAIIDTNGKLSATYTIKVAVNSGGQYYSAGMGIGVENTQTGMQSQVLFVADRFAVMSSINGTTYTPFAIQGGQVFINNAFIQNGSIDNAKIGSVIQSDNYIAGVQGWYLNKNGTLELRNIYARGDIEASSLKANILMVNTANINDASVNTLKIAGNAVTLPVAGAFSGTLGASVAIQNLDAQSRPVMIEYFGDYTANAGLTLQSVQFMLYRNGVPFKQFYSSGSQYQTGGAGYRGQGIVVVYDTLLSLETVTYSVGTTGGATFAAVSSIIRATTFFR